MTHNDKRKKRAGEVAYLSRLYDPDEMISAE